ncbi:MAG: 16S rRNA (cytosine(1402)-N(4))-methyltransferase RsmH [Clostridiales bacterium]|nr:16S rRNA (cytosine(1402)-N(4))-methyltransferase RsmH [Clostridiales bacterium]
MEFQHYSVMLNECIEGLAVKPDGVYADGTAGGAGHSSEIAKRLTTGKLLALDRDPAAVQTATERLQKYPAAVVIQANFSEIQRVCAEQGVDKLNGMMLDLGVSSYQLDAAERGFSYRQNAPLDMRMSQTGMSAKDIVNTYSVSELNRIIRDYGEEKYSYQIAKNIVKAREDKPLETTMELADIIKSSMPAAARREKNPCKRTFQAIRIAVNSELESLSEGLQAAFEILAPGGRLVVITFHSLEDRIVKQAFAGWCQGCICPPDFPVCVCHEKPKAKLINKKPILPSEEELAVNSRSQSAKLRILEKL